MVLAYVANDLQLLSEGNFMLGLGSQVKPHIERRFSMPWGKPVARMRETIAAIRAIWTGWETGGALDFRGEFFTHTLMTPTFSPGPNPYGRPKIVLGALGPAMTELAGEVADGFVLHRLMSERYLNEVTLPALDRGLARAGRDRDGFEIVCPPFVVSEADPGSDHHIDSVRKQLAFYGSTPGYHGVFELHGWKSTADELHELSRTKRWDAMTALIDDEILETFAVVIDHASQRTELEKRFGGIATRMILYP